LDLSNRVVFLGLRYALQEPEENVVGALAAREPLEADGLSLARLQDSKDELEYSAFERRLRSAQAHDNLLDPQPLIDGAVNGSRAEGAPESTPVGLGH
jgi:hypothetical protein